MSAAKAAPHQPLPLRRIVREVALQYLYQADMGTTDATNLGLSNQFWSQLSEERPELGDKEWKKIRPQSMALVKGVQDNLALLDATIESSASNWSIARMAVVDRNILRLAVHELLHVTDVPTPVCINEAVEVAKLFGGDESSRFVNGILDAVRRALPALPPTPPKP